MFLSRQNATDAEVMHKLKERLRHFKEGTPVDDSELSSSGPDFVSLERRNKEIRG